MSLGAAMDDDDICELCGSSRADHAASGAHHQFSIDGSLKPLPKARSTPPLRADELAEAQSVKLSLRLIERLTQKGLLTPGDLHFIFGGKPGGDTDARGSTDGDTHEPGEDRQSE